MPYLHDNLKLTMVAIMTKANLTKHTNTVLVKLSLIYSFITFIYTFIYQSSYLSYKVCSSLLYFSDNCGGFPSTILYMTPIRL